MLEHQYMIVKVSKIFLQMIVKMARIYFYKTKIDF